MESKANREGYAEEKYLNKRPSSSRKSKRANLKTIISNPSTDAINCARSIHLKPDLIFK